MRGLPSIRARVSIGVQRFFITGGWRSRIVFACRSLPKRLPRRPRRGRLLRPRDEVRRIRYLALHDYSQPTRTFPGRSTSLQVPCVLLILRKVVSLN